MIGVSLPFDWLCGADQLLGEIRTGLSMLKARGVKCVELCTVYPTADPDAVVHAVALLKEFDLSVVLHVLPRSVQTAVADVFAPLTELFYRLPQEHWIITLQPVEGDSAAMLRHLAEYAEQHQYPVMLALENPQLLAARIEANGATLALSVIEAVSKPNVGICFDMGNYMRELEQNHLAIYDNLPGNRFMKHVIHTHIPVSWWGESSVPSDGEALPADMMLEALCHEYFGAYNLSLDFDRFSGIHKPLDSLLGAVEGLKGVLPYCARLYEEIRTQFDDRFQHALTLFRCREKGTHFTLVASSSYLFNTNGFCWAMDLAFRNAYRLAETPAHIADLLADLALMVISHGHEDHFEKRTVQLLAKNRLKWVIPDFLFDEAISRGISSKNILTARPGEPLHAGPLTIYPFPGRHFRPTTGKGTEEYGYIITAPDAPTLAFPVDVRDFSLDGLPEYPPADVCFANVWLGDHNGVADEYHELSESFSRFMLRFSDRAILMTHLYESCRKNVDMWREEHAMQIADAIHAISPKTCTVIPHPGEILDLSSLGESFVFSRR